MFEQAIFDYAYPQAARRPRTVAPPSSPEDRLRGLALALKAFHAAGITSLTDALIGPADVGPKRLERMFAHRSFIDHGIPVVGSSDYPCGPFAPLLALQSCVTRTGADGTPLGLSQRITLEEALALYTINAAAASGEGHIKGRLAPGYLCDFVVRDDDPLTADPWTVGALGIRATYVGGTKVWDRDEQRR